MSTQNIAMSTTSLETAKSESLRNSNSKLKRNLYILVVIVVLLIVAVIVLAVLYAKEDSDSTKSNASENANKGPTTQGPTTQGPTTQGPQPTEKPTEKPTTPSEDCSSRPTAGPVPQPTGNTDGPYTKAAVAADDWRCSKIGRDVLHENGSAVDAAVAALFCLGVINMHSTGIGGGAVMVVYIKKSRTARYFNFRETAPGNATQDMFVNKTGASTLGGLAIAVPGEVKGLYTAWQEHGVLEWKRLVQPSIDLAREGFIIQSALAGAINSKKKDIEQLEGLREILMEDGCLKREGDRLVNRRLAITLERISNDPKSFYDGSLAEDIVNDIRHHGGIITANDLKTYSVGIEPAINISLDKFHLYTTDLPSSGIVLAFMINVLEGYNFTSKDIADDEKAAITYHRIIETFKYAYARRALLGDKNYTDVTEIYKELLDDGFAERIRRNISDNTTYNQASHYGGYYSNYDAPGTSHLSVLAPNGDAVAVTSTINTYFGSKVRSTTTGILYNNEMDDFSTPGLVNAYGVEPSPSNFIEPGKRPLSSMSPVIFTNETTGDVVFIAGASGGTRITTGTALAVMNKLWFGLNTSQAVDQPRFHDQLLPNYTAIENNPKFKLSSDIVTRLENLGHDVEEKSFYCVVQAVSRETNGEIYAKSDPRKGGFPAGF